MIDFTLPDDSYHYEWAREGTLAYILNLKLKLTDNPDTTFKPQVEQGIIRLLHADTWSIIDRYVICHWKLNPGFTEHIQLRT